MKKSDINSKTIKSHFQNAVDLRQNCKIYITTTTGNSFSFYFKKGNLAWATSSVHRFRRLYRLINKVCPEVNCKTTKLREQEISELWEYLLVNVLYKRKQITIIQAKEIVKAVVKEVLFDCFIACEQINQIKVIFETKGNQMGAILNSSLFQQPIAQINYQKILNRLELSVVDWNKTNLGNASPNYAPVIKEIEKLKKIVNSNTYQELLVFINGKRTIRDLSYKTQQNELDVINFLLPHIKSKAIALQKIPDQQLANLYFTPSNLEEQAKYPNREAYPKGNREYIQELELPLIICVDDSPNVCQDIAQILNPAGYRLLPVNDAAKALMVLLENQPSLIFLDTDMPDANGYELCAQIKKMPALKQIPIIMLREQENMVDLVRSKLVGAVEIVNKPINTGELLTLTQKYTQDFVDRKIKVS